MQAGVNSATNHARSRAATIGSSRYSDYNQKQQSDSDSTGFEHTGGEMTSSWGFNEGGNNKTHHESVSIDPNTRLTFRMDTRRVGEAVINRLVDVLQGTSHRLDNGGDRAHRAGSAERQYAGGRRIDRRTYGALGGGGGGQAMRVTGTRIPVESGEEGRREDQRILVGSSDENFNVRERREGRDLQAGGRKKARRARMKPTKKEKGPQKQKAAEKQKPAEKQKEAEADDGVDQDGKESEDEEGEKLDTKDLFERDELGEDNTKVREHDKRNKGAPWNAEQEQEKTKPEAKKKKAKPKPAAVASASTKSPKKKKPVKKAVAKGPKKTEEKEEPQKPNQLSVKKPTPDEDEVSVASLKPPSIHLEGEDIPLPDDMKKEPSKEAVQESKQGEKPEVDCWKLLRSLLKDMEPTCPGCEECEWCCSSATCSSCEQETGNSDLIQELYRKYKLSRSKGKTCCHHECPLHQPVHKSASCSFESGFQKDSARYFTDHDQDRLQGIQLPYRGGRGRNKYWVESDVEATYREEPRCGYQTRGTNFWGSLEKLSRGPPGCDANRRAGYVLGKHHHPHTHRRMMNGGPEKQGSRLGPGREMGYDEKRRLGSESTRRQTRALDEMELCRMAQRYFAGVGRGYSGGPCQDIVTDRITGVMGHKDIGYAGYGEYGGLVEGLQRRYNASQNDQVFQPGQQNNTDQLLCYTPAPSVSSELPPSTVTGRFVPLLSAKTVKLLSTERLLGEIAYQLDKRILNCMFEEDECNDEDARTHFYGFTTQNMGELMEERCKRLADGSVDWRYMEILLETHNLIQRQLQAAGYDRKRHPAFTARTVNTYGVICDPKVRAVLETLEERHLPAVRKILKRLCATQVEYFDMLVLLRSLVYMARVQSEPIFWYD